METGEDEDDAKERTKEEFFWWECKVIEQRPPQSSLPSPFPSPQFSKGISLAQKGE